MGSSLSIEEYAKRYREIAEENKLEVTDEEIAKMFASHIVISEWQNKEAERQRKRDRARLRY